MRSKLIVSLLALIVLSFIPAVAQDDTLGTIKRRPINYPSRVAIKTNLLYDAVFVPNLSVEVNCYNNFTVYLDMLYAGWNFPSKNIYWDLYGLQIGARKYFGKMSRERAFSGHHIGAYTQALAYDMQAGNLGQQTPSLNMGGGLDYGYSFPISAGFNIDVDLGFGFLRGKYYEYIVEGDHNTWQGTIQRSWWGPTKASVSLVWLIKTKKYKKIKRKKS